MQFLNCKKDEDTTVSVNATVANSSEGTVDFKSGDYAVGSSVTFTATPKTGYVFSSWTNTSTNQTYTTNPLSITVNENTNLVANFEKVVYNIMFTISGEGSVQKEVVGGGEFTHESQVKLTATPSENYSFFYWNNDPGDTENPKTITLEGDQNIPTKFDYQVARDLVGNWEFVISDPASKNVTTIKMSIDIFLNVLMTTIVNGEVISQIFTKMVAISTSAIVIGDFAVITDVVVASATSLSMKMVSIPEDTVPPTKESDIPEIFYWLLYLDTSKELNLTGIKSDEEPETDEDGIIIPPIDAITASSTTQEIGAIFDESFDKLVNETIETATNTSTVEEGSFLDRVNGKAFTSETSDYTAVFEFTNDIQGEFIKFHMIYDDCGETLINGSNIVAVTKNTENEFWFTFSINSENNSLINASENIHNEAIEKYTSAQYKNKDLPLDSRSKLIKTLTKLKDRPLLCKSRGTTTERVSETLNKLLRGLIPSVQEAKRQAGLLSKTKSYKSIGISGNPKNIAKKIINSIGRKSANQIANQILEALKNDR